MTIDEELNGAYEAWEFSLTSDEIESLRYYQDALPDQRNKRHFEIINGFFRDPDRAALDLSNSDYEVIEEVSARIDSAIRRGQMPEDVRVYRGMKSYEALFGGK